LADFEVHVLKGNHEDSLLRFLAGEADPDRWLANGGREMVQSYSLNPDLPPDKLRRALLDALPRDHRRLLRNMELSHIEGDYAFVHAGVRPGISWDQQSPDDLLWIREAFTGSNADFGHCVVHGHSPVDVPQVKTNRIAIDTRAWASGVLTSLVLENDTRRFLNT
jgi:serine/threonine protein phosphatase 1